MTGRIRPCEEARFGVDYFLEFATVDGWGLDGERILEKVLLQEVETEAVFPFGILHADKERRHTPTLLQVHPKQTRIPRDHPVRLAHQRNNFSTPIVSEKYLMDLSNGWVPENHILIIQAKSTLLNQQGGLIRMKYF